MVLLCFRISSLSLHREERTATHCNTQQRKSLSEGRDIEESLSTQRVSLQPYRIRVPHFFPTETVCQWVFLKESKTIPIFGGSTGDLISQGVESEFKKRLLCCNTLQRGAVRCSAGQCVAARCSAVQCGAVRCSALQCVAVRSSAFQGFLC